MPADLARSQPGAVQYARQSDVIYGRKAGLTLTMEVLAPARAHGLGVVWVVSSNGTSSREQTFQASFEQRIPPVIERGYTVFAVLHGSSPAFHVQDFVQDVRRAVRFIRHHASRFNIDGQRLGLVGSSSGGLIALVVAMARDGGSPSDDPVDREPSSVQAVGCFFPPPDLVNFGEPSQNIVDLMRARSGAVDPAFQFYDIDARSGARTLITERARVLDLLRAVSPVTHASADDPPTILIHGDRDRTVPLQQSRRLLGASERRRGDGAIGRTGGPGSRVARVGVGQCGDCRVVRYALALEAIAPPHGRSPARSVHASPSGCLPPRPRVSHWITLNLA